MKTDSRLWNADFPGDDSESREPLKFWNRCHRDLESELTSIYDNEFVLYLCECCVYSDSHHLLTSSGIICIDVNDFTLFETIR